MSDFDRSEKTAPASKVLKQLIDHERWVAAQRKRDEHQALLSIAELLDESALESLEVLA